MTVPRLLSSIRIESGSNVIRISGTLIAPPFTASGPHSVTIPAGTYHMIDDGSAGCILTALETAIEATALWLEFEGAVNGVTVTDSSYADGRIKYTHSNYNLQFDWTDPLSTLDPRILGFRASTSYTMGAGVLWSPDVHRYGWYPWLNPVNDRQFQRAVRAGGLCNDNTPDGVDWGEYEARDLAFDFRPAAIIRENAAETAALATPYNLSQNDQNCSLERFILDVTASNNSRVYYFPDQTDVATYSGPFVIGDPKLWSDPLARCSIADPAGELWNAGIPLRGLIT